MLSWKEKREMLLVFDPSFIRKSGKHTYGLARYWNGERLELRRFIFYVNSSILIV
jgi:hypothetical protein